MAADLPPDPAAASRAIWGVTLLVIALGLLWWLSDVVLLAFAGVLLALVLNQLTSPLQRWLSPRVALAVVVLALVLLFTLGGWLAGASVSNELQQLGETLPRAWGRLREWMGSHAPGRWVLQMVATAQQQPQSWAARAAAVLGMAFNGLLAIGGSAVLVVALGVYLAADPWVYTRGALHLVDRSQRARVAAALHAVAANLTRWLKGQAVSMAAVGVLTAIGLTVLGLPLVFTLSVLTAVLDFVPYFGSLAASVIIVAVAFSDGERQAFSAALMCLLVQQIEAYVVQPVAQRWAVRLPPALGLLSVLVFGLLFGLAGVLLAVPLMVVVVTLVQQWRGNGDAAPQRSADR
jgi:predicted PurR-regulated permease PerM